MKKFRIAGYILLLMAVLAGTIYGVNGECTACKGGSPTAQQDVLNSKWAAFMGEENATPAAITSASGLISPQYSRENNQLVQAGNDGVASDKPTNSQVADPSLTNGANSGA